MDRKGRHSVFASLEQRGVLRTYGGYARPSKLEPFGTEKDEGNSWLKPAIDEQVSNAWTLYDLRKLRFQDLGKINGAMERLIYGYEFLLVVPELTPADLIL